MASIHFFTKDRLSANLDETVLCSFAPLAAPPAANNLILQVLYIMKLTN